MKKTQSDRELRRKAEDVVASQPVSSRETDVNRLLHELQVHQVELEMRNGELRQYHDDLEKLLGKYTNLFELAPVGYLTLDQSGDILEANLTGATFIGLDRARMTGRRFVDFIEPTSRSTFADFLQEVFSAPKRIECIAELSRGNDNPLWVQIQAIVDSSGETCQVVLLDISGLKRSEEEKVELQYKLLQAQKIESIGLLAGGIAHDFNNLLSVIINNLELQQFKQQSGAPFDKNLAQIRQASTQAKDLVAQILTFSRQEKPTLVATNLSTIVADTMKFLRAMIPTTVEVMTVVSAEPLPIHADTTQFQQVLINLCNNAVHAMHEKGLLQIRLDEEELTSQEFPRNSEAQSGRYAKLSVTDSGKGMDKETLERIFDPFFTTKVVGVGTGMGLSVVHGVVEQHGGIIRVDSTPGQGSTFTLYFPITSAVDVTAKPVIEAALLTGTERILLVDDEPCVADSCGALLEDPLGYKVTVMTDSVEALDFFKAHPHDFDLVITDQTMPKISGVELAKEVLNLRPELPVILCSGYSAKVSAEEARELGISAFCMKPLLMEQLALVVRDVLDKSEQSSITE